MVAVLGRRLVMEEGGKEVVTVRGASLEPAPKLTS